MSRVDEWHQQQTRSRTGCRSRTNCRSVALPSRNKHALGCEYEYTQRHDLARTRLQLRKENSLPKRKEKKGQLQRAQILGASISGPRRAFVACARGVHHAAHHIRTSAVGGCRARAGAVRASGRAGLGGELHRLHLRKTSGPRICGPRMRWRPAWRPRRCAARATSKIGGARGRRGSAPIRARPPTETASTPPTRSRIIITNDRHAGARAGRAEGGGGGRCRWRVRV